MALLSTGEASSASQSMNQIQQDLLDLLTNLIKKLRADSLQKSAQEAEPLSELEQQQVDDLCAASVKDLLAKRGMQEMTEDGSIQHVYRTEAYTLSANLDDGTGYPVYTVACPERGDVLKFQDTPSREGGHTFYETQHELDDAGKVDLLASLKVSLETRVQQAEQVKAVLADALEHVPGVAATAAMKALDDKVDRDALSGKQASDLAASKVRADLESLGEFAPVGSKAALVAYEVLGDQNRQERDRDAKYSVQRQEDGTIELFEGRLPRLGEAKEPLVILPPDGKLICSQEFANHHAKAFDVMHRKLILAKSNQQSKITTKTKAALAPERSGR